MMRYGLEKYRECQTLGTFDIWNGEFRNLNYILIWHSIESIKSLKRFEMEIVVCYYELRIFIWKNVEDIESLEMFEIEEIVWCDGFRFTIYFPYNIEFFCRWKV